MSGSISQFQQIGKYEIREKIGEGGGGIVYKAFDPFLEREVAIKVLRNDLSVSSDFIKRFHREARLTASLRHPNIINVIEGGEHNGHFYIVMDYIKGTSLNKILSGEALSLTKALKLLRPVADALDYAHSREVIHRDIKPSNVLVDEYGVPILTDFGLVKSMSEDGITLTGVAMGTPEYMAPEVIQGQSPTAASDVYALAVMTYQMLTGEVPFPGETPFEIQKGHTQKPVPDVHKKNSKLPKAFSPVFERALAKDPQKRLQKAGQFITQLEQLLGPQDNPELEKKLQAAENLIKRNRLEEALAQLEQIQKEFPEADVDVLMDEIKRRLEILVEINTVKERRTDLAEKINEIVKKEDWLPNNLLQSESDTLEKYAFLKPVSKIYSLLRFLIISAVYYLFVDMLFMQSLYNWSGLLSNWHLDEVEYFIFSLLLFTMVIFSEYWYLENFFSARINQKARFILQLVLKITGSIAPALFAYLTLSDLSREFRHVNWNLIWVLLAVMMIFYLDKIWLIVPAVLKQIRKSKEKKVQKLIQ